MKNYSEFHPPQFLVLRRPVFCAKEEKRIILNSTPLSFLLSFEACSLNFLSKACNLFLKMREKGLLLNSIPRILFCFLDFIFGSHSSKVREVRLWRCPVSHLPSLRSPFVLTFESIRSPLRPHPSKPSKPPSSLCPHPSKPSKPSFSPSKPSKPFPLRPRLRSLRSLQTFTPPPFDPSASKASKASKPPSPKGNGMQPLEAAE